MVNKFIINNGFGLFEQFGKSVDWKKWSDTHKVRQLYDNGRWSWEEKR